MKIGLSSLCVDAKVYVWQYSVAENSTNVRPKHNPPDDFLSGLVLLESKPAQIAKNRQNKKRQKEFACILKEE